MQNETDENAAHNNNIETNVLCVFVVFGSCNNDNSTSGMTITIS